MSRPAGHTAVVAVVDDDTSTRTALVRLLSCHGYRVQAFASAEEFLACFVSSPSCVVIDIHLGKGMSGLDLGEAISASGSAIPIIFVTGRADPVIRQRALDLGCAAFLEKPVPSGRLIAAIRSSSATGS